MHVRICGGEPRGHPRGLLNGHADGNVGYSQAVAFPDLLAPYPTIPGTDRRGARRLARPAW